ncbi:MAG: Smr/MutS family protein [Planctomycetia bacterium]|nr:Smr/MutS family protein [Planctomycetia bacterium]
MKTFKADLTLNLHGMNPEAAEERVRRTLESGRYRGKIILIIHGQGRGILRERIRNWAKQSRLIKTIWNGEDYFLPGGGGVTAFFL